MAQQGGHARDHPLDVWQSPSPAVRAIGAVGEPNVSVIRHGETAWSLSGQHTGYGHSIDDSGRWLAERMYGLCSPPKHWRLFSGEYEGLKRDQIYEKARDWLAVVGIAERAPTRLLLHLGRQKP